jgi:hypothetical protein
VGSAAFESSRFSASAPVYETPDPIKDIIARYPVGAPCKCWHDPDHPEESVLER